jgi:hypothetical protein
MLDYDHPWDGLPKIRGEATFGWINKPDEVAQCNGHLGIDPSDFVLWKHLFPRLQAISRIAVV